MAISSAVRAPALPSDASVNSRNASGLVRLRKTQKLAPRRRAAAARCASSIRYASVRCAGTMARAAVSVRVTSDGALGEALERRLDVGHEAVGVGTVHDAVVERQR